jgi:uncharacterized protein YqeY
MSLLAQLQIDLVAAMKAKEELRLGTVRMLKTALMKWKADNMKEPDEAAELQVMNTLLKQRRESADSFRKNGREEAAVKEEAEFALIEAYMPSAPSEEEIDAAIAEAIAAHEATSAKQMGAVMKAVQAKFAGKRVDGKAISEKVKAKLT